MINTIVGSVVIFPIIKYFLLYLDLVEYIADPKLYPSSVEIIKQIMFLVIFLDALFYWCHRCFHTAWLYKKFHKQHHEYEVTVAIAAIYNHPVDYIITNILTSLLAEIMLVKVHVVTIYMWVIFATTFALLSHSGYDLPWNPYGVFPFGHNSSFHDYHHSKNVGNFGLFSVFWDATCGTNKSYVKSISKIEKNS